jgi:hypothetical protein
MTRWNRFLVGTLITIVLSVVAPVRPQDVVKVSPETHTILLENERVRVLDVQPRPTNLDASGGIGSRLGALLTSIRKHKSRFVVYYRPIL